MEKKYESVKSFCNKGYIDLERKCFKDDGHIILLSFSTLMNEYTVQVNAISKTIKVLKEWEKKDFFKLNETKYEIDWFGCYQKKGREEVTLPQAKKMYKEVRLKYDALYEVLLNAGEIHYKNKNALIDKYVE